MDELEISGKRYISTKRAGKDHKYHPDYIGQLIRGQKVPGQKVGRSWYVDANALAAYLGSEAPAPASLANRIKEKASMPVVIQDEEQNPEQEIKKETQAKIKVEKKDTSTPIYRTTLEAREAMPRLRYIADDGPLLPPIKKTINESSISITRYAEPQPIPARLHTQSNFERNSDRNIEREMRVERTVYTGDTTAYAPVRSARPTPFVPSKKIKGAPLLVRAGTVLLLGAAVFGIAGLISMHLLFTLTVEGDQSTTIGYSIK